jgi:hypothetical protein
VDDRVTVRLACKGRRRGKPHRPDDAYVYDGPWPLPPGWSPRLPGSTFDLKCPRCGFAPRPGDDGMRALIEMAAGKPGRILYIDGP